MQRLTRPRRARARRTNERRVANGMDTVRGSRPEARGRTRASHRLWSVRWCSTCHGPRDAPLGHGGSQVAGQMWTRLRARLPSGGRRMGGSGPLLCHGAEAPAGHLSNNKCTWELSGRNTHCNVRRSMHRKDATSGRIAVNQSGASLRAMAGMPCRCYHRRSCQYRSFGRIAAG
jgi:hypothetical protein